MLMVEVNAPTSSCLVMTCLPGPWTVVMRIVLVDFTPSRPATVTRMSPVPFLIVLPS